MPGIPLLFTDAGGVTPDQVYNPLSGLYPGDNTFPSDGVWPFEGPPADAYAVAPSLVASGIVETVTAAVATAQMEVPSGLLAGDIVEVVSPLAATAFMPLPTAFAGVNIFEAPPAGVATAFMTPPQTSGAIQVILVPSVRELPPLRLSINVTTPGGRRFRWGEDEPNPINVPSNLRFSDTVPGGFDHQDCTLPRKPNVDYGDLERLSTISVTGAGGQVAWEGRLERAPRTSGDEVSVSPSAVGWQAALEDDKSASMIYIDRDQSSWTGAPSERRLAVDAVGFDLADPSVDPGLDRASLRLEVQGPWAAATPPKLGRWPMCEAWYDSGPSDIAHVFFTPVYSVEVSTAEARWALQAWSHDPDGTTNNTADLFPATGAQIFSLPTARRRAFIQWYWTTTTPFGGDGTNYGVSLYDVAVVGAHGVPATAGLNNSPWGYLASNVVAHAVSKWAPELTATVGPAGTIQPSGFAIPHLVFKDFTTAGEIVRQATRVGLQDWGVWENKTFWFGDRGSRGRRWRARSGPTKLEETGPTADRLFESVVVQYQDVDGSTRTVGPPGSNVDFVEPAFKDNDPDNPANRAGITRRALLTMGTSAQDPQTNRPGMPIEVGRRFLEEQKLLDSSGRASLVGHVESDRGVLFPYWAVRAGDTITFTDAASAVPRRIVRTEKDHGTRTCSIDLDAPPEGLQALLERLGVGLTDLGFS